MAIYRLLGSESFDPESIAAMTAAYESAFIDLELVDRNDPRSEMLAKSIIAVASTGERSPDKIKERALSALGVRKTDAA